MHKDILVDTLVMWECWIELFVFVYFLSSNCSQRCQRIQTWEVTWIYDDSNILNMGLKVQYRVSSTCKVDKSSLPCCWFLKAEAVANLWSDATNIKMKQEIMPPLHVVLSRLLIRLIATKSMYLCFCRLLFLTVACQRLLAKVEGELPRSARLLKMVGIGDFQD